MSATFKRASVSIKREQTVFYAVHIQMYLELPRRFSIYLFSLLKSVVTLSNQTIARKSSGILVQTSMVSYFLDNDKQSWSGSVW